MCLSLHNQRVWPLWPSEIVEYSFLLFPLPLSLSYSSVYTADENYVSLIEQR